MPYKSIVDPVAYNEPSSMLALMKDMRANAPVTWVEPPGFRPFWAVSKYHDIKFIESNNDSFEAAPRTVWMPSEVELASEQQFGRINPFETIAHMDGAKHRSHRNVTRHFFMPNGVAGLKQKIDILAQQYVNQMAAQGGQCDFAADVAYWFPLRVMMSLIGVPEADDKKILRLTQRLFGFEDQDLTQGEDGSQIDLMATAEEFNQYFSQMVVDRREHPQDDIATLLAQAQINGGEMGELELISYFVIMATGGHDTTSATIAGGLQALIENPEQLEKLQADMSLLPSAVDEMLRWVCPVKHFMRTAAIDIEVGGQMIRQGEAVALLFWSACHDESVIDQPEVFNIERVRNVHLAFGHGPHICIGQHLAKLEIIAFFEELLPRLKNVELSGEAEMVESNFVSGLKRLPLRYQMQ